MEMGLHSSMNSLRTIEEWVRNEWDLAVSPEVADTESNGKALALSRTEECRAEQTTCETCACPCRADFDS